jgi:hypothetical protein
MSATPGGAGRSTQRGDCCGGPADVATKRGRASKTEDRPAWRETRCARHDGSLVRWTTLSSAEHA